MLNAKCAGIVFVPFLSDLIEIYKLLPKKVGSDEHPPPLRPYIAPRVHNKLYFVSCSPIGLHIYTTSK